MAAAALDTVLRCYIARRSTTLALSVIVAVSAAAVYWAARTASDPAQLSNGGLSVPIEALEIGGLIATDDYKSMLPIRNVTPRPIAIVDWRTSCSCAAVTPRAVVIPPYSTTPIDVKLDLTSQILERALLPERPFQVTLNPVFASGDIHDGFRIRGTAFQPIAANPTRLTYGGAEALVRGAEALSRKIVVTSHEPVAHLVTDCQPAIGKLLVSPDSAHADHFVVAFTPDSRLPAGVFHAVVTITAHMRKEGISPIVKVPVDLHVVSRLKAVPEVLNFGAIPVHKSTEQSLVVESFDASTFQIEGIEASSSNVLVMHSTSGSSHHHLLRVATRPSQPGYHQAAISVRLRLPDGQTEALTVRVESYAYAATED